MKVWKRMQRDALVVTNARGCQQANPGDYRVAGGDSRSVGYTINQNARQGCGSCFTPLCPASQKPSVNKCLISASQQRCRSLDCASLEFNRFQFSTRMRMNASPSSGLKKYNDIIPTVDVAYSGRQVAMIMSDGTGCLLAGVLGKYVPDSARRNDFKMTSIEILI